MTTRTLPVSSGELQKLVRHAWLDLQRARAGDDRNGMLRAERRMNAMLDMLAKRKARCHPLG